MEKIKFEDLSTGLKVAAVASYLVIASLAIAFLMGLSGYLQGGGY